MNQHLSLTFPDNRVLPLLYGGQNSNLTHLEKRLGIAINQRGNVVSLSGAQEAIDAGKRIIEKLYERARQNFLVGSEEIDDELRFMENKQDIKPDDTSHLQGGDVVIKTRKKTIAPRSPMQQNYLKTLMTNDLVIGCGPAGTGKTYLAVAAAVHMFLTGKVERIILSRPAVEAGEKIGFLPGDVAAKLDPYLRPLYDSLFDMMPQEEITSLMATGTIEIAPLAFMRGRTLSNSFIILDEAQNTTPTQMKMFLTRLGMGSRMAITGDTSQIDLPKRQVSGIVDAMEKLKDLNGISIINFSQKDVVRHPLAAKIVENYEKFGETEDIRIPYQESWL